MKRHLFILSIVTALLFNSAFAQTVYITKTGKKYHEQTCRYLSRSSFAISLTEAIERGYDPCSICKPVTSENSGIPKQGKKDVQNIKVLSPPSAQSVQCSATTKKGSQCKRTTKSANGRCWQHGGT